MAIACSHDREFPRFWRSWQSRTRGGLAALLIGTFLLYGGAAFSSGVEQDAAPAESRDLRLVLLLTVDQFRFDLLTRFAGAYESGLARLMRDGAVFVDANLEHYPTVTAPGHATFGSGALLSTSGIIGNDWFDRESGKSVTSVSDSTVTQLGGSSPTSASPHRLQVSTVADELKLSARARGAGAVPRAIGISLKDRSAILPVGRSADAAYWFDTPAGEFVTSSYYMESLPEWVRQFNAQGHVRGFAGRAWPFLAPPARVHTLPSNPGAPLHSAVYASPFGNELLARFAEEALDAGRLGQRETVDVLAVSFSSNDAVGHTYGPHSPEVRAITLQVDHAIGALFAAIDRRVGLDRTIVVFTSDHGVAPLPEVLAEGRLPGGRLAQEDLFGPIRHALAERFGEGHWILATAGSSPYLNYALMEERGIEPAAARAVAAAAALGIPQVSRVYTRDQLLQGSVPSDLYSRRVLQSFHPQRSGDLEILLDPLWIRQKSGTTHGTPYSYDAHIPLVFMGPGIRRGQYAQPAALNDVAATLATMLGIATPAGSAGRVLGEILIDPTVSTNGAGR